MVSSNRALPAASGRLVQPSRTATVGAIKRELRRRSAIEPVIGHMKAEGHLGRCYLKGRDGDAANVILTAVGYNFRRILAWLRAMLRKILIAILRAFITRSALNPACSTNYFNLSGLTGSLRVWPC